MQLTYATHAPHTHTLGCSQVGKSFYDNGGKKFRPGEFVVLVKNWDEDQYYCERKTNVDLNSKSDIELYGGPEARALIATYESE